MELYWEDVDEEEEALFNHMVNTAFFEATKENEVICEAIWHNDLMRKYFDYERYKEDLLRENWMIVQSRKGFAICNNDNKENTK